MRFSDGAGVVGIIWRVGTGYVVMDVSDLSGNIYRIAMPSASGTLALTSDIPDVPAWALAAQKPTYTADEVGAASYQQFTNHTAQAITTIRLTNALETVASINSRLATINANSEHVYFDTSAIEASQLLYLVTFYIDEAANVVRVCDQVTGKLYVGTYKPTQTIGDIIANAVDSYVSIAVSAETLDGVTVTNQTVSLYEGNSPTGPPRDTAAYEGASVSFTVPRGFEYYLEITDNWEGGDHFGPHITAGAQTGVANSAAATTFTYYDPYHIDVSVVTNFTSLQETLALFAGNADAARANLVGIELPDTWTSEEGTVYDDPLIVVDVDVFTNELNEAHVGAICQRKWATLYDTVFDQRNQDISTDVTAQVNTYYYGFVVSTFDDAASYASGKYVVYDNQLWRFKAAKTAGDWDASKCDAAVGRLSGGSIPAFSPAATYAANDLVYYNDSALGDTRLYKCSSAVESAGDWTGAANWTPITLDTLEADLARLSTTLGETIPTSGYFLVFKTALGHNSPSSEANVKSAIRYGHNRWRDSAYRQYLNSDAAKGGWWTQKHVGQVSPGSTLFSRWGYKRGCSSNLLAVAKTVAISSYCNGNTDASAIDITYDTFWLPSGSEMVGNVNSYERSGFAYWKNMLYGALVAGNVPTERYEAYANFPATGEAGKVYQAYNTGMFYTWNGSSYANITNDDGSNATTGGRIRTARRQFRVSNHGSAVVFRLRSANRSYSYSVWYGNATGYLNSTHASTAYASVPACVIW